VVKQHLVNYQQVVKYFSTALLRATIYPKKCNKYHVYEYTAYANTSMTLQ